MSEHVAPRAEQPTNPAVWPTCDANAHCTRCGEPWDHDERRGDVVHECPEAYWGHCEPQPRNWNEWRVWNKNSGAYICHVMDGRQFVGPFPTEADATRALTALRSGPVAEPAAEPEFDVAPPLRDRVAAQVAQMQGWLDRTEPAAEPAAPHNINALCECGHLRHAHNAQGCHAAYTPSGVRCECKEFRAIAAPRDLADAIEQQRRVVEYLAESEPFDRADWRIVCDDAAAVLRKLEGK